MGNLTQYYTVSEGYRNPEAVNWKRTLQGLKHQRLAKKYIMEHKDLYNSYLNQNVAEGEPQLLINKRRDLKNQEILDRLAQVKYEKWTPAVHVSNLLYPERRDKLRIEWAAKSPYVQVGHLYTNTPTANRREVQSHETISNSPSTPVVTFDIDTNHGEVLEEPIYKIGGCINYLNYFV